MAATNFQSDDSGGGGVIKNPRSPGHSQTVSSPWSTIVQGPLVLVPDAVSAAPVSVAPAPTFSSSVEEKIGNFTSDWCPPSMVPDVVSSPDESGTDGQGSDSGGVGGNNASKKPVWNKPSNGVVEVVSPVMGAVSWPALGESTKGSPKSSSSESLKALADGPLLPTLPVTGISSPLSHKHTSANNVYPTSTQNHAAPARQRSMRRGGGSFNSNSPANGGLPHISATTQDLVVENLHNTSGKPGNAASDPSPRDKTNIEPQRGNFGPQSHNGNDHQHQRSSYRRSNSGQNHNYGGKRDQDRGNHEWNQHSRSFNGRDTHMQPQRGGYPRGYIRPSVHTSTPYMSPQMSVPVRPFGNNMMYHDLSPVFYVQGPPPPPDALRAMPLVAPVPPSMFFAVPDPSLHGRIVSQIDYYFSNENLVKDTYLRQNMDEQGWVPVSLIAGFKKVLHLTDNIQLILDAMRASTKVEVQGNKIRRRNDWMKWLMNSTAHYSNLSSPRAVGQSPNQDLLASQLHGVTLDDTASKNLDKVDHVGGQQGGLE